MTFSPRLTTELQLLTQALERPGTDIADTLTRLIADARTAVASYVGMSVAITTGGSPFEFTVLDQGIRSDDIETSLLVPLLSAATAEVRAAPSAALILYAATPGAFVDLAADLSWITGRHLTDFRLDEHRTVAPNHADATPLNTLSVTNQAIGVLIEQGATPEDAERDLYARAAAGGIDVLAAATLILDTITQPDPGPARP